jgi:hypothetical protein
MELINNIKKHQRVLMVFALSGLFIFHVTCTVLFNFPDLVKNPYVVKVVQKYMFPVFNQNLKVFAPDPPIYRQAIEFRYHTSQGWSNWIDPGSEIVQQHPLKRGTALMVASRINDLIMVDQYALYQHACFVSENMQPGTPDSIVYYRNKIIRDLPKFRYSMNYFIHYLETKKANDVLNRMDSIQTRLILKYPGEYKGLKYEDIKTTNIIFYMPSIDYKKEDEA